MQTLIAVSTFKKNKAIENYLNQLYTLGYMARDIVVLITDDNNGEAKEVYEKFLPLFPTKLFYMTGERGGVSLNKNRGIWFFLNKTNASYLILSDDDIKLVKGDLDLRLIEASKNNRQKHITTYGDYQNFANTGKKFSDVYKTVGESEDMYWSMGVQGIFSFFTRELIEQVGYFNQFPYFYGYEHCEHSTRCNMVQGYCPEVMPIYKWSYQYIKCQGIPNDYDLDFDTVTIGGEEKKIGHYDRYNLPVYQKHLLNTKFGLGLNVKEHGLGLEKELIL